jgi:ubiquinone/menaquinone biosynthesis C-methylase UbiE
MNAANAQEKAAEAAFSKQSGIFDQIDEGNSLIGWMRDRVRKEVMSLIAPSARMLELNCGTGLDAMYFAQQGVKVHATDQSKGMLKEFAQKLDGSGFEDRIRLEECSFNDLSKLYAAEQYDFIFSNFGGLNCSDQLGNVLKDLDKLLRPGGRVTLVLMPKFCPWEVMMLFRGYFKTAFRRFGSSGAGANVEGVPFQCYYYDPSFVIRHLGKSYRLLHLKSLGLAVPPPYIEGFKEKRPKLFHRLESWEKALCARWPFNRWGDHYMISLEKSVS